jgi:hypothetical protein
MPALQLFVVSSVDQELRGRTGKKIWDGKNMGRQKYGKPKIWEAPAKIGEQKYS